MLKRWIRRAPTMRAAFSRTERHSTKSKISNPAQSRGFCWGTILVRPMPLFSGGEQNRSRRIGKNSVVLAFFVYANTPGGTRQLMAYQDGLAGFEQTGAQVLGISVNKPEA